jgi:hypothetical protein
MLEVLQQDYIRTARAKGIGQTGILFVHALIRAADFQKTQKVWQTRRLCESGKRTERDE